MTNGTGYKLGAVTEYLRDRFGGDLREYTPSYTIQTTVGLMLDASYERVALLVVNLGANNVYLAPTSSVSITAGIRLTPSGGWVSWNMVDDFILQAIQWWGLAETAAVTVWTMQLYREHAVGR